MKRVNAGEWYDCELYSRKPNSKEFESTPKKFTAQVFTPKETFSHDPLKGALSNSSMIAIRTSEQLDFKFKDKVKIVGEEYLIQRVAYDLQQQYGLGARRFNEEYIKRRSEKLIYLQ